MFHPSHISSKRDEFFLGTLEVSQGMSLLELSDNVETFVDCSIIHSAWGVRLTKKVSAAFEAPRVVGGSRGGGSRKEVSMCLMMEDDVDVCICV